MPLPDLVSVEFLRPNPRNVRTHSAKQVAQIAESIRAFGFIVPVVARRDGTLLAGHGRLDAAKKLGLTTVPAVIVDGLNEAQERAFALADNRIPASAGYDRERLAAELQDLQELLVLEELDLSITGFAPAEIDELVCDFEDDPSDPADDVDAPQELPVSCAGDEWLLSSHRLRCGDARSETDLDHLMAGKRADAAFLDAPYNLSMRSIGGKHPEFAMASGEMSRAEFVSFLQVTLANAARVSRPGAVHFTCMDWRHFRDLVEAGECVYADMLNTVVWAKTNAGQGNFYRSQHELIAVFRVEGAPHLNNVEQGRYGVSRSNLWRYAGANTFRKGRDADLAAHPTVKPVAMVADALKDCTRRGDIVLDTFSGSGTTILAAERVGRRAYALEYEPRYVDVAIRRWQAFTGRDAIHVTKGQTFDEVSAERITAPAPEPARARR